MQPRTKTLLAAGGVVALLGAVAVTAGVAGERGRGSGWHQAHGGGWGAGGGGGWHGGPGGGRAWSLFEDFDVNDDGRLTQAEVDEVRAQRFAAFDQNGDGELSLEEYQALWLEAMRPRLVDRFQAHDDDGDAAVTVEEFAAPFAGLVSRMDRNGDGELTTEELRGRPRGGERGRGGPERDDG